MKFNAKDLPTPVNAQEHFMHGLNIQLAELIELLSAKNEVTVTTDEKPTQEIKSVEASPKKEEAKPVEEKKPAPKRKATPKKRG